MGFFDQRMRSPWNFTVSVNPLTIGRITEFKYDALNRLLKKYDHGQEATPWVAFTYLASGQRDTMTDGTGVTDYEYCASGRLWKKIVRKRHAKDLLSMLR